LFTMKVAAVLFCIAAIGTGLAFDTFWRTG
jgi:hypothetical protein